MAKGQGGPVMDYFRDLEDPRIEVERRRETEAGATAQARYCISILEASARRAGGRQKRERAGRPFTW